MSAEMGADMSEQVGDCDEAGAPFGGGDGSAAAPYLICTASQLRAIGGVETPRRYRITRDIDLTGVQWEPIEVMFGELHGGGHTIRGLRAVNTVEGRPYVGGLVVTQYGEGIEALRFEGLEVSGAGQVAGVVHLIEGVAPTLRDVHVTGGKISATETMNQVGSIAGIATSVANAQDLSFEGEVAATGGAMRGAGMVVANLTGAARGLRASGTMTLGALDIAGGLVGAMGAGATLEGCEAQVMINTSGGRAGGLVGLMSQGARLSGCRFEGVVAGSGAAARQLGGAVGQAQGIGGAAQERARIERVSVRGEVRGAQEVGGLVGNLAGGALEHGWFEGEARAEEIEVGCAVGSFARLSSEIGLAGVADHVWTDCEARSAVAGSALVVGGVTGDRSDVLQAARLVWNAERTAASGFVGEAPGVRGLTAAQLREPTSFEGWPGEVWMFVAGEPPRLKE